MMSRLCHLIELRNAPCRARNNAYLRAHRANLRIKELKRYTGITYSDPTKQIEKLRAKAAKSWVEYDIAYDEASKVIREVSKEISKLKKQLGIKRLQRMSMCPIIQNIYIIETYQYLKAPNIVCLNGKAIREQAAYYAIEEILLK